MTDSLPDGLVTVAKSAIHGVGVFASCHIDKGTFIGTYTGRPTAVDGIHVLWVEGDDGTFTGIDGDNMLSRLNHSSSPNVEFDGPQLFATHPIEVGDELVFHYGEEWEGVP